MAVDLPACENQGRSTAAGAGDAADEEIAMELRFIRKTRSSITGNCPALYRAENGNYVVQGWRLDDATRANLRDLADNETAVEVPADVIADILAES